MATEVRPLITKPLTNEQALALCDADHWITVRVRVPFSDLFADEDRVNSNDILLAHAFENDYLPTDISYNPVGIEAPSPNAGTTNDIILEITCNLEEMVEEDEEDDTANELEEIDPNPGNDPND